MLNNGCSSSHGKERLLWPTKPEACEDEDTMMPPPPALLPLRRPSLLQGERDELKVEMMEELSQHSMSMDGDSPEMQGVDLSVKTTMFPHLAFAPSNSGYLKTEPAQQFPTLYENEPQQFIEDVIMRPPPSKIHVRDFTSEASSGGGNFSAEKESASFAFGARVRSGSFSHSSSLHDNSMSGFETFSRVRSASMSHAFNAKGLVPVAPLTPVTPMAQSNIDGSGVKQATHEMQVSYFFF